MTSLVRAGAAKLLIADTTPILRQVPTLIAFSIAAVLAVNVDSILVTNRAVLYGGIAAMAVATAVAVLFTVRFHRVNPRWMLVVPFISLLAIGLFRASTGGGVSVFHGLLFLPVLWIAAEEGRRWIVVSAAGTAIAILLTYVLAGRLPETTNEILRVFFMPLVITLGAAVVNELARRGRRNLDSVRALAEELTERLDQSSRAADDLRVKETRLLAADQLTRSVLDAVTEQSVIGTDLTGLIDVWNPGAEGLLGLRAIETQGHRYIYDFHDRDELRKHVHRLTLPSNHLADADINADAADPAADPGTTDSTTADAAEVALHDDVANLTDDQLALGVLVIVAAEGNADVREWIYVRADGSRVCVRVAVTLRTDADGHPVGFIFVANDITRELEVARLKDEFISLVSHELRTPLSSILGYIELLRDDTDDEPLSDERLEYLSVAERNAHRLLRLVGDLMFTAQVESGGVVIKKADIDLRAIVAASLETAAPMAESQGVRLCGDADRTPLIVSGDGFRLGQACDNLISNAVKFTPGGGTVTVSLEVVDAEARLSVRDTGIGIPADELDKLYSRFFRASTATRHAVQGVGLGLTITRAIVTSHGGRLDVASEEEVGTVFTMVLPLG
ncbi:ATP-binding protein [Marisediminicola senii]|uniref:ATP-binding protein n=1 Tax=Marisediminicola senii TaxID=2711233 RepID=UPI0013EB08C8|nr:ATP-binding protein [Marisediminicola senii]